MQLRVVGARGAAERSIGLDRGRTGTSDCREAQTNLSSEDTDWDPMQTLLYPQTQAHPNGLAWRCATVQTYDKQCIRTGSAWEKLGEPRRD